MEQWPNFFGVGVTKAGTTTLYSILRTIPEIYLPEVKEPNYFNRKTVPDNFVSRPIRKKNEYLDLYKNVKKEKVIGDMTVGYFPDALACKLIHETSPNAKILISLRDPVERCYSVFLMNQRNGWTKIPFREEIEKSIKNDFDPKIHSLKINQIFYSKSLKNWINTFGKHNVKIIIFEEFIKNQKQTINDILEFLGIKYEFNNFTPQTQNAFGIPRSYLSTLILKNVRTKRHPKLFPFKLRKMVRDKILLKDGVKPQMLQEDREFLQKFFEEDVREVEKILGRKLPWKNFNN